MSEIKNKTDKELFSRISEKDCLGEELIEIVKELNRRGYN